MLLRVASLILDTYVQGLYISWAEWYNSLLDQINDYMMMSFYFIETIPSLIIIVVLWKSNNELKYKNINSQNNPTSGLDESLNLDSKKNRSEVASIERLLDDNSFTEDHINVDPSYFQSNNNSSQFKDHSFNHK